MRVLLRLRATFTRALEKVAGVPGFEPGNADTKNRCLTTWRHPNEGAEIATLAVAGNTRSHP